MSEKIMRGRPARLLLSLFLSVTMAVTMIPFTGAQVYAASTTNSYGHTIVTSAVDLTGTTMPEGFSETEEGSGIYVYEVTGMTWYADEAVDLTDDTITRAAKTLVLDGVTINCTELKGIICSALALPEGATVVTTTGSSITAGLAEGENGSINGIMDLGDLTFEGPGALTVAAGDSDAESDGIYVHGQMTVCEDAAVYASAGTVPNGYSCGVNTGDLENNGTLTGTAARAERSIGIYGDRTIVGRAGTMTGTSNTTGSQENEQAFGIYARLSITNASGSTMTGTTEGDEAKLSYAICCTGQTEGGSPVAGTGWITNDGNMTGTSGAASLASNGIYAYHLITNNGTMTGTSGTAGGSFGIFTYWSIANSTGADMTAVSGESTASKDKESFGSVAVYAYGTSTEEGLEEGSGDISNDGEITATSSASKTHSCAIFANGEVTNKGTINAKAGESETGYSNGLFAHLDIVNYGELTAESVSAGTESCGISVDDSLFNEPKATLKVTAGTAGGNSFGIYVKGLLSNEKGATLETTAGDATSGGSVGIDAIGMADVTGSGIVLNEGTLTAAGGTAGTSVGIMAYSVVDNSGRLTAKAGESVAGVDDTGAWGILCMNIGAASSDGTGYVYNSGEMYVYGGTSQSSATAMITGTFESETGGYTYAKAGDGITVCNGVNATGKVVIEERSTVEAVGGKKASKECYGLWTYGDVDLDGRLELTGGYLTGDASQTLQAMYIEAKDDKTPALNIGTKGLLKANGTVKDSSSKGFGEGAKGAAVTNGDVTVLTGAETSVSPTSAGITMVIAHGAVYDDRFGGTEAKYTEGTEYTVHGAVKYVFAGWYTGIDGTGKKLTGDPVNGTEYYAKWTKDGKTVVTEELDFTNKRSPSIPENSGITWDRSAKTLTLEGATVDCTGTSDCYVVVSGIRLPDGSTVITKTESSVTGGTHTGEDHGSYGIYGDGDLNLGGTGKLIAIGGSSDGGNSAGIVSAADITVEQGADVLSMADSTGTGAKYSTGMGVSGTLVNNGKLTAQSYAGTKTIGIYVYECLINGPGAEVTGSGGNGDNSYGIRVDGAVTNGTGAVMTATAGSGTKTSEGIHTTSSIENGSGATLKGTAGASEFSAGIVVWEQLNNEAGGTVLGTSEGDVQYSYGILVYMSILNESKGSVTGTSSAVNGQESYGICCDGTKYRVKNYQYDGIIINYGNMTGTAVAASGESGGIIGYNSVYNGKKAAGDLTAVMTGTAGTADYSNGIYAYRTVTNDTGGKMTGTISAPESGESCVSAIGINCFGVRTGDDKVLTEGTGIVTNKGTMVAEGQTATLYSIGIDSHYLTNCTGGAITASAGSSGKTANGINLRKALVAEKDSTITAKGGVGTVECYGIWVADDVTVDGTLDLTGGYLSGDTTKTLQALCLDCSRSDSKLILGAGSSFKADGTVKAEKEGYTFAGWYRDQAYTNAWTFGTDPVTPTETTYIYPKFTVSSSGGSGGGGGGGGSSSSVTTVTVPVSGDTSSVNVAATISDGTATVKEITTQDIDKVGEESNIVIDLSASKTEVSTVSITVSTLENISESKADGVEIKISDEVSVVLDTQTVAALAGSTDAKNVQIDVTTGSKAESSLNEAQKETVSAMNNATVIDATLTAGGKDIGGDFNGGSGSITVKAEPQKNYRAWYVDENGKKTACEVSVDRTTGVATIKIRHCSIYVLEEIPEGTGAADAGSEAEKFVDVAADAYYADAVAWAVANGITAGTDETHFSPEAVTTRAQLVTFLWRAEGSPEVSGSSSFTDVAAGSYYEQAVAWAAENGYVNGIDAAHFAPDQPVTRAQAVTILARMDGVTADAAGYTNGFSDVAADAYYSSAVAWALANNITTGTSADKFSPDAQCTRGQIVTFLYRSLAQ